MKFVSRLGLATAVCVILASSAVAQTANCSGASPLESVFHGSGLWLELDRLKGEPRALQDAVSRCLSEGEFQRNAAIGWLLSQERDGCLRFSELTSFFELSQAETSERADEAVDAFRVAIARRALDLQSPRDRLRVYHEAVREGVTGVWPQWRLTRREALVRAAWEGLGEFEEALTLYAAELQRWAEPDTVQFLIWTSRFRRDGTSPTECDQLQAERLVAMPSTATLDELRRSAGFRRSVSGFVERVCDEVTDHRLCEPVAQRIVQLVQLQRMQQAAADIVDNGGRSGREDESAAADLGISRAWRLSRDEIVRSSRARR